MAARRRSYSWTVDHPGWVVTLDSLEEQSVFDLGSPPSVILPAPRPCSSLCLPNVRLPAFLPFRGPHLPAAVPQHVRPISLKPVLPGEEPMVAEDG